MTFRSLNQIYDAELDAVLNYLRTGTFGPLSSGEKFGPIMSYLAPGYRLAQVDPATPSHVRPLLYTLSTAMRLTTFIKLLGDGSEPPFPSGHDMVEVRRRRRDIAGRSIERARRIETEAVAQRLVIPALNRKRSALSIGEQLHIVARLKALPKSRRYGSVIEHIIRFTPAISACIEVHTVSALDITRQDKPNDFFDCDLLTYALSYAGTFAAADRWLASLVNQSRKSRYPTYFAFAPNLEALERCLDRVASMGSPAC